MSFTILVTVKIIASGVEVVCEADAPYKVTRVGTNDIYTDAAPHDQVLDK